MSYPTFRRRFRAAMQVSPGAYRVRRRLEQARLLLLEKPVKQVAEELGYSDPFTFSAQFKAHFGLSPQHFQMRETPLARDDGIASAATDGRRAGHAGKKGATRIRKGPTGRDAY